MLIGVVSLFIQLFEEQTFTIDELVKVYKQKKAFLDCDVVYFLHLILSQL